MFVPDYAAKIVIEINLIPLHHFILKQKNEMEDDATENKENKGFIQMNIRW